MGKFKKNFFERSGNFASIERTWSLHIIFTCTVIKMWWHSLGHIFSRSGSISYDSHRKMVVLCNQLFPFNNLKPFPKWVCVLQSCWAAQCLLFKNKKINFMVGYGTVSYVTSHSKSALIAWRLGDREKCDGLIFVLSVELEILKCFWKLLLFLNNNHGAA